MSDYHAAARIITERSAGRRPLIAVMLGSGLGALTAGMVDPVVVPYAELPGFPQPTVAGHDGRLLIGVLHGTLVVCLQGRAHHYEGHGPERIGLPIRALHAAGCRTLILTNAAGSLRPEMGIGSLMMLSDHINWACVNPLAGPNDAVLGPRFPDMSRAYDPLLRQRLRKAAAKAAIELFEGVSKLGPGYMR